MGTPPYGPGVSWFGDGACAPPHHEDLPHYLPRHSGARVSANPESRCWESGCKPMSRFRVRRGACHRGAHSRDPVAMPRN